MIMRDGRRDTSLEEVDPYEPGGALNDPLFDEYYSLHFQTAVNSFLFLLYNLYSFLASVVD